MFCAIATTIERCKTEGVVDVFQVVKALRVQKPGAVPTVVSHMTLHPVAGLVCATGSPSPLRSSTRQYLRQFYCSWTPLKHMPTFRTKKGTQTHIHTS